MSATPGQIALVAGVVAALRREWPAIDGRRVYLAVLAVAACVALCTDPAPAPRALLLLTLTLWVGAVGLASGASYVAAKAAPPIPPKETP